jgi:hypothetical protein
VQPQNRAAEAEAVAADVVAGRGHGSSFRGRRASKKSCGRPLRSRPRLALIKLLPRCSLLSADQPTTFILVFLQGSLCSVN